VLAQNDNTRTGAHGSYIEYTATEDVSEATIKVLPLQRSMRGSYQLYVSITPPDLTAPPPSPTPAPAPAPAPAPPPNVPLPPPCTAGTADTDNNPATDGAACPTGTYAPAAATVCTKYAACRADADSNPASAYQACASGKLVDTSGATVCTSCSRIMLQRQAGANNMHSHN
jgi:type V secretory pathway adhesin AidA